MQRSSPQLASSISCRHMERNKITRRLVSRKSAPVVGETDHAVVVGASGADIRSRVRPFGVHVEGAKHQIAASARRDDVLMVPEPRLGSGLAGRATRRQDDAAEPESRLVELRSVAPVYPRLSRA